jgi:hypothetical protein
LIHRASQLAWLIFALAVAVFLIRGADRPRRPRLIPNGAAIPARAVAGFDEVGFKVAGPAVPASLVARTRCALLAKTAAQQSQGLMNRRDLAGYDGMIFQFGQGTTVQFYMKDTLIPLSIAWFDATGRFLNQTDMPPCPKSTLRCPTYSATAPYTVAIEVSQGGLTPLGLGPGSTITVGGPC